MKQSRVKVNAHVSYGVGFYSFMTAMVFGDTSESVDEVISPRFLFVYTLNTFGLIKISNHNFKIRII